MGVKHNVTDQFISCVMQWLRKEKRVSVIQPAGGDKYAVLLVSLTDKDGVQNTIGYLEGLAASLEDSGGIVKGV